MGGESQPACLQSLNLTWVMEADVAVGLICGAGGVGHVALVRVQYGAPQMASAALSVGPGQQRRGQAVRRDELVVLRTGSARGHTFMPNIFRAALTFLNSCEECLGVTTDNVL